MAAEVLAAMQPYWNCEFGNPSSAHSVGQRARQALARAREQVAALIGSHPDEILFTSGGTESNNLAILGLCGPACWQEASRPHLVISAIEHPAISEPARYLEQLGVPVSIAACMPSGVVPAAAILAQLRPTTRLVSVMQANNETGAIQPIAEIADICRARHILCHTDAAQAVGKIDSNVVQLGVDLMTIAGHKLYAPKGIGVLYVRRGIKLQRVLFGASQEQGLSPGTECVPLIVAMGAAAELAASLRQDSARLQELRDALYDDLRRRIGPELHLHAEHAARLPNTLSLNFPGVSSTDLLRRIPNLCASIGAACHGSDIIMSNTLRGMQVPPSLGLGTIRLSLGRNTTRQEIELAAQWLEQGWREARGD